MENRIGRLTAKYLVGTKNALLLDVRSAADIDEDGCVTIADLSLVKIGIGKGYGNN